MKKVLITGALGLLGSSLVPYLKQRGHQVIRQARKDNADLIADLTITEEVFRILDEVKPDVIVNLAALTNVDECERIPQAAYLSNVRIVENLTDWIKVDGNRCHLIQISTDQVYEGPGPHQEKDIHLINMYGFSKYAGELAASTVPSTILRTNFYGKSLCNSRISLSDWLLESLRNQKPITVLKM